MSEQMAPETAANRETSTKNDPFAPLITSETTEATLGTPAKRRRTAKPDAVLAAAQDVALAAVQEIAPEDSIGSVHHLRGEEDRLTTHLFECTLGGYRGWFWFATLARAPRAKVATVCEVGLLPGDDALLAPAWVPWSERIQESDGQDDVEQHSAEGKADDESAETQLAAEDVENSNETETAEEAEAKKSN